MSAQKTSRFVEEGNIFDDFTQPNTNRNKNGKKRSFPFGPEFQDESHPKKRTKLNPNNNMQQMQSIFYNPNPNNLQMQSFEIRMAKSEQEIETLKKEIKTLKKQDELLFALLKISCNSTMELSSCLAKLNGKFDKEIANSVIKESNNNDINNN